MERGERALRNWRTSASKPFAWVTFPRTVDRKEPVYHDQWRGKYTGTLAFKLTLLTPLHIGSGLLCLRNGKVVKEFYRCGGKAVIPGSSLKGVFRSIAEAISNSCVSKTRGHLPDVLKECGSDGSNRLCVCCRLFGGRGYKARVRFHDAHPLPRGELSVEKIQSLWKPRILRRGWKFYKHGRPSLGDEPLEILEVFPKGTCFSFEVEIESLNQAEMNLLLTAMGIFGDFYPKLGGAKSRCFGSAEVKLLRVKLRDPQREALQYERTEYVLSPEHIVHEVQADKSLIDEDRLNELRTILGIKNWKCPSGAY